MHGEPDPVAAVTHRYITCPTADVPIVIYRPDGDGPFPALIWFHGSGWVILNLDVSTSRCAPCPTARGA